LFFLSIIFTIGPNPMMTDPLSEAKNMMSGIVGEPGALKSSNPLTFEPGYVLSGAAIAEMLPISSEQICMSTGEFGENSEFELTKSDTQDSLVWNGSNSVMARIMVVCDLDLENLEMDFEMYEMNYPDFDCSRCQEGIRCCALLLRKA